MNAVLLRVGVDKGYGAVSPVFKDNSFEYIPIYYKDIKERERKEKRTYKDLIGVKGKPLSEYLPINIINKKVHLDPEFESYTYGEVGRIKRSALLRLERKDLLIFYMGGYYNKTHSDIQCFIFGFFEVDRVFDWSKDDKEMRNLCSNNAHIISSKSKNNLVIVKGTAKSRLLSKCIQISETNKLKNNPPYVTMPHFQMEYGLRKNIVRAVPMWIKDTTKVEMLRKLLKDN